MAGEPRDQQVTGSSVIRQIVAPDGFEALDRWPSARREQVREESIARLVAMRAACPGWDAVPLLRRYPSLVVMARDSTAAIRGWRGTVHLRAGFGALGPITVETEKKIAAIEVTASGSRVDRYAMAFWARARALAGASMSPDEPEKMEPDLRGVSWRREADLKAMRMVLTKEASDFTAAEGSHSGVRRRGEREVAGGRSGWR